MQSIKDIYKVGFGPSSSHTIAPMRAAEFFKAEFPRANRFEVELFGSLALTGKGHKTDKIIASVLGEATEFKFHYDTFDNRMIFKAYFNEELLDEWNVLSIGGGSLKIDKYETGDFLSVYPHHSFDEIKDYVKKHEISLLDYIYLFDKDLKEKLEEPFNIMIQSVENGLAQKGLLNEDLSYYRAAKYLRRYAKDERDLLIAYAYAAGEENASGHKVCTAPTLGSCGIIASLMYHYYNDLKMDKGLLIDALAIGGLFGNIIKNNATIAGSVGGCQAEVGTACSMAAAMIAFLDHAHLETIEYAAEVGMEHHLGLTCDPVKGYVIVPCIERNGAAILRAFDAYKIASNTLKVKRNMISFDMVVNSMNDTSKKLPSELKETSLGGLALEFIDE